MHSTQMKAEKTTWEFQDSPDSFMYQNQSVDSVLVSLWPVFEFMCVNGPLQCGYSSFGEAPCCTFVHNLHNLECLFVQLISFAYNCSYYHDTYEVVFCLFILNVHTLTLLLKFLIQIFM